MSKLTDKIKNPTAVLDTGKRNQPLWEGPSGTGPNGGITFSMLSRYLACKERFRIQYLEGLQVKEGFNHRLEFGNMWHICEEVASVEHCTICNGSGMPNGVSAYACPGCNWQEAIKKYASELHNKYPLQRSEISHWFAMCYEEFPEYIAYWARQKEEQPYTTLMQEQVFDVPYKLPSGRTVRLRGKWDRVDLQDDKVYLGENKTKSQIDSIKIKRQLTFDLQTMLYLITLQETGKQIGTPLTKYVPNLTKIGGVKYNVVRRSAHKSPESMLKKIREDITDGRGSEWFARWTIDVTLDDIQIFKERCLNPILEGLCDWYSWATSPDPAPEEYGYGIHHTTPFGIYNPMLEGGSSEYDEYLVTGSQAGLERTDKLFRELQ